MADYEHDVIDNTLPLLPLRDVVVYPHMVIPLFVGREKSIRALEKAMTEDKQVLLVAQKNASVDEPEQGDLYGFGTVSAVLQLLKLPDGTIKVLVEGRRRARIDNIREDDDFFVADFETFPSSTGDEREADALMRSLLTGFENYVNTSKKRAG